MTHFSFSTLVDTTSSSFQLDHSQQILMLGSCFTANIGHRLIENKFSALVNPFGTLYNPASIFRLFSAINQLPEETYFQTNDEWHNWWFDTTFSSPKMDEAKNITKKALDNFCQQLHHLDVLFLTFGTNHTYILKDSPTVGVVANCHKQPSSLFEEKILSIEDITTLGTQTLKQLFALRPQLQVIFTISPYRYAKYGFHGNQLCKATLLLAVDQLCQLFPKNCHYFPAYEILLDELRDYRFYASDMIHPSDVAADYIWQQFLHNWVSPDSQRFVCEWQPILRDLHHRPLHPESPAYKKFLNILHEKMILLSKKYPNFAFQNELDMLPR